MTAFFENVLTASFHGSLVILAILLLRPLMKGTPKKFRCLLWLLAGVRLLMPFEIRSDLSLQPSAPITAEMAWVAVLAKWMPWLWGLVAAGFAAYTALSYGRLKRQVREAVPVPGGWECAQLETAFILGFIRPKIYIPMHLSPKVRGHILSHERTHLDKGDHWIKMIGFLALALHWFNPLVWVAYILLCKDIELACDERVVQYMDLAQRKEYSTALLDCSTQKAHFAACPVAFGEVSIKERIMAVLTYKKPSFWMSLIGVIAVCFVGLCLVTSPNEAPAPNPSPEAPMSEAPGFAQSLRTEADILAAVDNGLKELVARDSYYVVKEMTQNYKGYTYNDRIEYHKHGVNSLYQQTDTRYNQTVHAFMELEGNYYSDYGDYWVSDGTMVTRNPDYDPDFWIEPYLPENMTVTFEEGQGVIDQDTVTFNIRWDDEGYSQEGQMTVKFNTDSTIASVRRAYDRTMEGEYESSFDETWTVQSMRSEAIDAKMRSIADSAITYEEMEEIWINDALVTEIPSNKMDYDKDFALGSELMGWQFLRGTWFFKFGAADVTGESLKLVVEFNNAYDSDLSGGVITASENYWLERMDGDTWVVVDPIWEKPIDVWTVEEMAYPNIPESSSFTLNYSENYGVLPGGRYRIGNFYTVTMPDGSSDTQACYAKFRIYDGNQDELMTRAKNALDNLRNADSYRITSMDFLVQQDYDYYITREVCKSGEDLLGIIAYPYKDTEMGYKSISGSMWRDGKFYSWDQPNTSLGIDVENLWYGRDGYMDGSNISTWDFGFEWYDGGVEMAYQEGDSIHIVQGYDFDARYQASEIILYLDDQDNLVGLRRVYLPTRDCAQSERVLAEDLTVQSTDSEFVRDWINDVRVDVPLYFNYAAEEANHPEAKKEGFVNTTANPIQSVEDAIALADKECTLPQLMEFEKGYCQMQVFHDPDADMWKVRLYWWQHDSEQTIYMDGNGITKLVVTIEE